MNPIATNKNSKKDYSNLSKEDLIKIVEKLESRKKYGLIWDEDKVKEQFEKDAENALPVLKEVKGKEITDKDDTRPVNILIEGDNYHALSVLNFTHQGKVDVIYIDPPYNTGNRDFIYNDNYVDSEDEYKHSKWLSFMSKRLRLAKNLLRETGVIFISIDDNEQSQLRLLCDEVFGLNNFVTTLHVQMSTVQGQKVRSAKMGNIVKNAEYILVYSKDGRKTIGKNVLYDPIEYDNHYSLFINKNTDGTYSETSLTSVLCADNKIFEKLCFLNLAKDSKGKRSMTNNQISDAYAKLDEVRDFINKKADQIVRIHDTVEIKDKEVLSKVKEGILIEYGSNDRSYLVGYNGKGEYKQRIRLSDKVRKADDYYQTYGVTTIRGDWWPGFYLDMGNVAKEGGIDFKNGKKPIRLIKQLIHFVSDDNATILDFFAGSGSTGHAVVELNKDKGTQHKFILCTNNEENICLEKTYPRLNNVLTNTGVGSLKYFKTKFIKKTANKDDLKIRMTKECTEMLCLREGIFDEVKTTDDYRVFQKGNRVLAAYYSLDRKALSELKKDLSKIEGEKILYCFTLDPLGLNKKDFSGWKDVTVEPIPQKILDVYKQIYEY